MINRHKRLAVLTSGLLFLLLAQYANVACADSQVPPPPSIELVPDRVTVPWEDAAHTQMVLRNHGDKELRDVRLSWYGNAPVQISTAPQEARTVPAHSALAWTIALNRNADLSPSGDLYFRVDYSVISGTETIPALVTAPLTVVGAKVTPVAEIAEVELETAMSTLMERHPGSTYLTIRNKSDVPIQLIEVRGSGPEFVTLNLPTVAPDTYLAPGEARTLPIEVEIRDRARTGPHMLLLEALFAWREDGRLHHSSITATHMFNVGILGESEFLVPLGVPSFLVLPGFLVVVTLSLLWRYVYPKGTFPYNIKSTEFWFLAISLSLVSAFVYPLLTGWVALPRNYLDGYSLVDIRNVWFGAIVTTLILYMIGILMSQVWAWVRRAFTRWRLPRVNDTALTVLRKLHRQGMGLRVPVAILESEAKEETVYLLQPWSKDESMVWVGSQIRLQTSELETGVLISIEAALNSGNAGTLTELLEEHDVATDWIGAIRGGRPPVETPTAALKVEPKPRCIVLL